MTDSNLFKEIEEDLERQKYEALWKKYGSVVLAGAITIVVAAGATSAWTSWKNANNQNTTDAWHQALTTTKEQEETTIKALQEFAKAHNATEQAALARLQTAALLAKRGDKSAALAAYNDIMTDQKTDAALRQLAILNAVRLDADSGDKKALLDKLQPLLAEGTAWRPSATELAGHLAMAIGDVTKARQYFSSVAQDATAPLGMTKRADSMLRYLSDTAHTSSGQ